MSRIPVFAPRLGAEEVEAALACLRSGAISGSGGREIERFEAEWAGYCGRRFGVAVVNGSAALDLALDVLDLPAGSEVILPTFTIVSCLTAVLRAGAMPVLVDSDPATGCMDVAQVERRITARTGAILAVHIYGHPVDMDPLLALAARHGLVIVEDAAEAHGAEYLAGHGGEEGAWRRCGGFGELSTFSFYANKPITTGEGGMVLTDDEALVARLRSRRNLGFGRGRRFLHEELGWNFRLSNLLAAIGRAQVAKIAEVVRRKRELAAEYARRLEGIEVLELPRERAWARSIYWMYAVVVRDEAPCDAAELAARLDRAGIETRPFFLGMHEQPALHGRGLFVGERYPVAERLARRGLYLPSGLDLTAAELDRVADELVRALR
ncbi:MAG TPA: DegT/DnrJ/EryC1/StrS family aminotransferase [Thermoanaerobaculia bacterium]